MDSHGRKGIARTEVAQRGCMPAPPHRPKVFLISPATAHGPRALSLRRAGSNSTLARQLRAEGVPLGDVFTFLSGLYFRGKLEYARVFSHPPAGETGGVYIITMTDGLVPPHSTISLEALERYALCREGAAAATSTLESTARALARRIGSDCD